MAKGTTGSIELDVRGYFRDLDRFAKNWGLSGFDVLRIQTRLYGLDLQRNTPAAKRKGGLPGGLGKASSSKYKDPIERSIRRVGLPSKNITAIRKMRDQLGPRLEKTGTLRLVKILAPDASVGELVTEFKRKRRRSGRVPRQRERFVSVAGSKLKLANVMHVSRSTFRSALKVARKKVGFTKSGWNAAIVKLGGSARIPGFVRALGNSQGSIQQIKGRESLEIIMINKVPWASKFRRLLRGPERKRAKDLDKHLAIRLDQEINKENRKN